MKIYEITSLNELSVPGPNGDVKCTKDCSGTLAGLNWEKTHNTNTPSNTHSPSFNRGTEITIGFRQQGKKTSNRVRGDKGRWVKYQGRAIPK